MGKVKCLWCGNECIGKHAVMAQFCTWTCAERHDDYEHIHDAPKEDDWEYQFLEEDEE